MDPEAEIGRAKGKYANGELTMAELEAEAEFWQFVRECRFCGPHGLCTTHYEWYVTGCWPDYGAAR